MTWEYPKKQSSTQFYLFGTKILCLRLSLMNKMIWLRIRENIVKLGSDWVTVYVRKTINDEEGKKPLPDVIECVKFSKLSRINDEEIF
ncbi:prolyl endopeptidase-like protein [Rhizophagus clarus]|uniref:Prolyl endopeptidase-like protein n=1 Tax=Rhizophagus clarus TaxID=94130 RepID=A0A8H3R6T8_9GLOM|nr:prolyl endopeptidase-like protein [Rhizophagus clarus]